MIEVWVFLFIIVFIRNKFIQHLKSNNIYLYQQYKIKPFLKHKSSWLPLFMLFLYIVLEILYFNNYYQISEYTNIFKSITILSYFILICQYDLYDSMYDKYKGKGLKAFVTSPFMLAIVCLFIGYALNYIAIQANSGHMPVFPTMTISTGYTDINEFTKDSFYILGGYDSKMIPLCDIFDLFGYSNLSLGDLLIRCYAFVILFFSIKKLNEKIINKI